MQIHARIPLSLPNTTYKIKLIYNTFVESTYDNFLAASIVKNAKNDSEIESYINDITGKGSLNSHLKKICEKIKSEFNQDQINSIIESSLYPKRVIATYSFVYYKMLNASIIKNKGVKQLIKDDLNKKEHEQQLIDMLMPKDKDAKFESIEIEEDVKDEIGTLDYYDSIFSDKNIEIALEKGEYFPISKNDFAKVFMKRDIEIEKYRGEVKTKLAEGDWVFLSTEDLNSINNSQGYKDFEGNYAVLTKNGLKVTEVLYLFDLYFFREIKYEFKFINKKRLNEAIKEYIDHKWIGSIKTSIIIEVLEIVDEQIAQRVVQHVLSRKNDRAISEYGLSLIENGLEKGWEDNTIEALKINSPVNKFTKLYEISPNIKWSDEDLTYIDNDVLTEIDSIRKKKYLENDENIRKEIKLMLGDIVSSGIREKMKKLQQSELKSKTKNFLNTHQGHFKEDIGKYNHAQLIKFYNSIKPFYENDFPRVKAQCNKL